MSSITIPLMPRLDVVRASSRGTFRHCRRKWLWSLGDDHAPTRINAALMLGTACHAGLQAYYGGCRTLAEVIGGYDAGWDAVAADLDQQGFLHDVVAHSIEEQYPMGRDLLSKYVEYDAAQEENWQVEALEQRFTWNVAEDLPTLSGQIDMLVRRNGRLVVVDHKVFSSRPPAVAVSMDLQLQSYMYLVWRVLGEMPSAAILNVLVKKKPAITVSGLKRQQWANNFARYEVECSEAMMASFERSTCIEFGEMKRVHAQPALALPSPGWMCASCFALGPCSREQIGMSLAGIEDE